LKRLELSVSSIFLLIAVFLVKKQGYESKKKNQEMYQGLITSMLAWNPSHGCERGSEVSGRVMREGFTGTRRVLELENTG
jgi:hypothetical protein